jgi:integrase
MGRYMGRQLNKLSALKIAKPKLKAGYYADGGGLYLQVTASGAKSWVFRFTRNGRAREMGLGPLHTVGLSDARDKATIARKLLLDGIDPIDARKALHEQQRLAKALELTFNQCAAAYIEQFRAGWKNAKHVAQWSSTLDTYAGPIFGLLPVASVDTALVLKALEPIWYDKPETASRLRGRIESVLSWATVKGYRAGDNPARWRGHLDKLLPKRTDVSKVTHHPALPYADMGEFMQALRKQPGTGARALEFAILTAARTGEVIGATWGEINADTWAIPASRMKAKKKHSVPLSPAAMALLSDLPRVGAFIFPGAREGKPLSNMSLLAVLKRMGRIDLTTHGFRSSFKDWATEQTNFPAEVSEAALAHVISDKTQAAYQRGDLFEKRAKLMAAWATYCDTIKTSSTVVPIGKKKNRA